VKATIIEYPTGMLAFNEENRLIAKVFFPKNPKKAARALTKIQAGSIAEEVTNLIKMLQENGYHIFIFENENLAKEVQEKLNINVEISKPYTTGEVSRSSMEMLAVDVGFIKDAQELSRWMQRLSLEIAKIKVKRALEKKDLIIAQAIQALDDVDKTINLFMNRVREWYGIHFPELDRLLDKHETYARLAFKFGSKDNLTVEKLEEEGIPKSKAQQIFKAADASMGADLTKADLTQIQSLCKNVLELYQLRQTLEDYLDSAMEEVAPNTKTIVGSLLGARLIALAGGLTNLAKMPASTIQVLGAEKALFRSLKTGTRPPKHGIIFQHILLHEAKKWQRGKIARAIAGKLAIAARTDAFGGRYAGEKLREDLERRIKEIQEKYVQPPQISEKKSKRKGRRKKKHAGKG